MHNGGLAQFGAYRKAIELFDLVVQDTALVQRDPRCYRLVSQQVSSADSICANIEEGYGRLSRAEYARFLDFARGSARETQGRYGRLKHWLSPETVHDRVARLDEIIGILTTTIARLRRTYDDVRDAEVHYEVSEAAVDEWRDTAFHAGCCAVPRHVTLAPRVGPSTVAPRVGPSTPDPRPSERGTA